MTLQQQVLFHIITDDPLVACLDLFCCEPVLMPRWMRVISDPELILSLPSGAKCRAQWYSARGQSQAELSWRDRRLVGGLDFISSDDEDRILDWFRRRDEAVTKPSTVLARPEPELQRMTLTQRWT